MQIPPIVLLPVTGSRPPALDDPWAAATIALLAISVALALGRRPEAGTATLKPPEP